MPVAAHGTANEDDEPTAAARSPAAATAAVLPASPPEGLRALWPEGLAAATAGAGGDFALTRAEEL
jgi:hypothetical protein